MDKSRCYFYLHVSRNNGRERTIWINKIKLNFVLNETRNWSLNNLKLILKWRSGRSGQKYFYYLILKLKINNLRLIFEWGGEK